MRWLWVTDPWSTLDHPFDTTLRLIEEARAQGHACDWCDLGAIRWDASSAAIDARRILSIEQRSLRGVTMGEPLRVGPAEFDRIVFRPDMINRAYVHALQLLCVELERAARDPEVVLVNPPSVLLGRNEKLDALTLGDCGPISCVSSHRERLLEFLRAEGRAVLKPLHLHRSKGVRLLDVRAPENEPAAEACLREATSGFTQPVLLQRFLDRYATRERRLWFCDGRLVGAAAKVPPDLVFPPDPETTTIGPVSLDADETRAVEAIGRGLGARRVRMAGVDLVDGTVTEVNMLSPGLLVEIEALGRANLAKAVITSLCD